MKLLSGSVSTDGFLRRRMFVRDSLELGPSTVDRGGYAFPLQGCGLFVISALAADVETVGVRRA